MEIPKEIQTIGFQLHESGYRAYLVGGCVRDLQMGTQPKDWDITTDAKPEAIQTLFPESVYENHFGTVLVKLKPRTNADHMRTAQTPDDDAPRTNADYMRTSQKRYGEAPQTNVENPGQRESAPSPRQSALNVVEVTTFRLEGTYTDKRHPDEITFAKTIEEDLSRRDFTVNAMALPLGHGTWDMGHGTTAGQAKQSVKRSTLSSDNSSVIDLYKGQDDLKKKIIRAVGNPDDRFTEDALRLMRAVRFSAQLGFAIEEKTAATITKHARLLELISKERVRDEFMKLIMTERAADGIRALSRLGLLRHVIPELQAGAGVGQNKHHIYDVFEHNVRALAYCVSKNYSFEVRLASLLHDVAKPDVKKGEGPNSTFYAHEVVGGKMTARILDRLHFPKTTIEHVSHLVRFHLFYYNVGEVSPAGVRRFIRRVGPEYIDDLLKVREADRIGSGVPKAFPYKLRHLLFMIEKVKRDPISPRMLAVNGEDIKRELAIAPGPEFGEILDILLEEVLEDPQRNTREHLLRRMNELHALTGDERNALRKKAESVKEEFEAGAEEEMKKKFYV